VQRLVRFLGDPSKAWFALLYVSATLPACGNSGARERGELRDLPADGDLAALPAQELERMFAKLEANRDVRRVALATDAIRLAYAHARASGSCGVCERTRAIVERALEPPLQAAACETGLAYAELLAKRADDLEGARAAIRSLVQHSERWPSEGARCGADARRRLALMQPTASDVGDATATASGDELRVTSSDAGVPADGPDRASGSDSPAHNVALEAIHVYGTGLHGAEREVRVVLGLDGPAAFRESELPADDTLPRRAILDLDGVVVAPGAHALLRVNAAGLLRVRAFVLDVSTTRVSFDIEPDASYRAFALSDPYRVIIDFRPHPEAASAWTAQRTIVLDPGHGGSQSGAHGPNGIKESVMALSIAVRVRRILARKLPGVRVVLTREANRTVTLEERSAIANALDAELFLSIHLNASPSASDASYQGGIATYVFDTAQDAQARGLAARENGTREPSSREARKLLAGLDQVNQVAQSRELAQAVHAAALRWGRRELPSLPDRGVKQAPFYVLAGARMPAALCEVAFITHPDEATALEGDSYRDLLAQGIAEGIRAFSEAHAR
jgi:N-acetylmuramoyl-L-alanine amidase